jgi:hypothetical protein
MFFVDVLHYPIGHRETAQYRTLDTRRGTPVTTGSYRL